MKTGGLELISALLLEVFLKVFNQTKLRLRLKELVDVKGCVNKIATTTMKTTMTVHRQRYAKAGLAPWAI